MFKRKAGFLGSPYGNRKDMMMREQGVSSLLREQQAASGSVPDTLVGPSARAFRNRNVRNRLKELQMEI
jgi:hypothetical protein